MKYDIEKLLTSIRDANETYPENEIVSNLEFISFWYKMGLIMDSNQIQNHMKHKTVISQYSSGLPY
jgi:hypothetical protein